MENSIYHLKAVYNCLKQLNLCRIFPHIVIKHILAVLLAVFSRGYKGKTVIFSQKIREERITYFYQCGTSHVPLEEVLTLAE